MKKRLPIFLTLPVFLFAFAFFMLTGCDLGSDDGNDPYYDSDGGVLTIKQASQESLSGVYQKGQYGLEFYSSLVDGAASVKISTLTGQEIIQVKDRGAEMDLIFFKDYKQTAKKSELKALKSAAPGTKNLPSLNLSYAGDPTSVDTASNLPEYDLLPFMSRALGEMGYTGNNHPVSYMLHACAMGVANQKNITLSSTLPAVKGKTCGGDSEDPVIVEGPRTEASVAKAWFNCYNGSVCLLGNCPKKPNCYGMCGPKCQMPCWWWICGDCCAHLGCAVHDRYCGDTVAECTVNFWQFFIGGCTVVWL